MDERETRLSKFRQVKFGNTNLLIRNIPRNARYHFFTNTRAEIRSTILYVVNEVIKLLGVQANNMSHFTLSLYSISRYNFILSHEVLKSGFIMLQ